MDRKMLNQLQQMQKKLMQAQEDLGKTQVEGSAGGGVIEVKMNGHREIISITIAPEAVDPNEIEMLQDLLMLAINDASKKAEEISNAKMGPLTGGLNIPGLF
ncbi:nucleoid-associated protein [Herpetosiphon geysericola]|uniref:Nucleoid-associated protein SE18_21140 n=2 Tax=Herpetosiphon geysericola TaxID=70996 RepID=A0A0P6YG46_9CHLR|nr:YbaB/EbfC family nucleoid-associated protein [Herpetosiphon geysericola]KPL81200.1 nucleoid-associated protein [Herpetosiphon geysericola]